MSKRDYYEVLGVSRDATGDQVKKAYRQLALKFHPDRNPDDKASEDKFKEASEAYQILSDESSREKYDRFGHAAFDGRSGFSGFGDMSGFAEEIFGDIFGAFFGNSGSQQGGSRRSNRGRDLRYGMEITLEEAAFGCEKEITFARPVSCDKCSGSGAKEGSGPETCKHCGGSGQQRISQGFFTISRPCAICNGQGVVIADPCTKCSGVGRNNAQATLNVKVPPGIDSGQRLKVRGEGEPGPKSAPSGDLYVEISVKPHEFFQRQETELVCEMPITFSTAALGGEVEVPTLKGKVSLKIPPGTPSGKVFRVKGKGVPNVHTGERGDQHVRTYVYVPRQMTDRERELLQELSTIEGKALAGDNRSFFERVKDLFE